MTDDEIELELERLERGLKPRVLNFARAYASGRRLKKAAHSPGVATDGHVAAGWLMRPDVARCVELLKLRADKAALLTKAKAVKVLRSIALDARAVGDHGVAVKAIAEAAEISGCYPESTTNVFQNTGPGSTMQVVLSLPPRIGKAAWDAQQAALPPGQRTLDAQVVATQPEGVVLPLHGRGDVVIHGDVAGDVALRTAVPEAPMDLGADRGVADDVPPGQLALFPEGLDAEAAPDLPREGDVRDDPLEPQIRHGAADSPGPGEGLELEPSAKALPDTAFTESEIPRSKLDAALDAWKRRGAVPRARR